MLTKYIHKHTHEHINHACVCIICRDFNGILAHAKKNIKANNAVYGVCALCALACLIVCVCIAVNNSGRAFAATAFIAQSDGCLTQLTWYDSIVPNKPDFSPRGRAHLFALVYIQ